MIYDDLRLSDIEGWLLPVEAEWLYERGMKSKRILEIGCFKGRSTLALAWNDAELVVCDTFDALGTSREKEFAGKEADVFREFWGAFSSRGVAGPLVIVGPSICLRELLRPQFDFIFIDGSHDGDSVRNDLETARRVALPGCIVAVHDYGDVGRENLTEAVRDFFAPHSPCVEAGSIAWGRI